MNNPPFCADCRHFLATPVGQPWRLPRCTRITLLSMIDGSKDYPLASAQRNFELDEYCGPAAKFFEAKESNDERPAS